MPSAILNKIKAFAGLVSAFVGVVIAVVADDSISLDEINVLWVAAIPILTFIGVYASPKNQP